MKLEFKVKISEDGSFKLPIALPKHSTEIAHSRSPLKFKIDARKLIKQDESNRDFFLGGSFNIKNLPANMVLGEIKFITDITISF